MVCPEVIDLLGIDEEEEVLADKLDHVEVRRKWGSREREPDVSLSTDPTQLTSQQRIRRRRIRSARGAP